MAQMSFSWCFIKPCCHRLRSQLGQSKLRRHMEAWQEYQKMCIVKHIANARARDYFCKTLQRRCLHAFKRFQAHSVEEKWLLARTRRYYNTILTRKAARLWHGYVKFARAARQANRLALWYWRRNLETKSWYNTIQ